MRDVSVGVEMGLDVCLYLQEECHRFLGNLILNWPKLLRPLKTGFFSTLYPCVCVRNVILHNFRYKEARLNIKIVLEQFKHAELKEVTSAVQLLGRCLLLAPYLRQ